MRTQIYTADIVNLETVVVDDEGQETRSPTIVPNLDGERDLTVSTLGTIMATVTAEPNADARMIVLVSRALFPAFADPEGDPFDIFDPIERVADVVAGNVGSILGMQVVINDKSDDNVLAIADVLDKEEGVIIRTFGAAIVRA